jgi:hypothetical protein
VGTNDVEAYLSGVPSLERVIAAPEIQPQAYGGGRRIVTSVEIWSNGVVVRTADIAVDIEKQHPAGEHWLSQGEVVDNTGVRYRFVGGALVSHRHVTLGHAWYEPKPSEDANLLSVRLPMTRTHVWIPLGER